MITGTGCQRASSKTALRPRTSSPGRPRPSSPSSAPGGSGAGGAGWWGVSASSSPGLIVILALSALFLATHPPKWVRGAAAGAGAAVAAVAAQRRARPRSGQLAPGRPASQGARSMGRLRSRWRCFRSDHRPVPRARPGGLRHRRGRVPLAQPRASGWCEPRSRSGVAAGGRGSGGWDRRPRLGRLQGRGAYRTAAGS